MVGTEGKRTDGERARTAERLRCACCHVEFNRGPSGNTVAQGMGGCAVHAPPLRVSYNTVFSYESVHRSSAFCLNLAWQNQDLFLLMASHRANFMSCELRKSPQ